jgi:MFS family permease
MLLNFFLLLPTYTRLGTKYLHSPTHASFAIIIGSSIILCLGSTTIALSAASSVFLFGMIIYTLGEGMSVATQAYIASLTEQRYLARVMAVLSIAAALGKALASLLFPRILAAGLDTHVDVLVGLPFTVNAALFLFAGACVVVVGVRTRVEKLAREREHENGADGIE